MEPKSGNFSQSRHLVAPTGQANSFFLHGPERGVRRRVNIVHSKINRNFSYAGIKIEFNQPVLQQRTDGAKVLLTRAADSRALRTENFVAEAATCRQAVQRPSAAALTRTCKNGVKTNIGKFAF